ncbi:GatB/YqeY domain-containing protein [Aromatoleum bremense]|uniref:GatB/YqeY domain-containing protein n=1 Tax=Aromatoleum bremense TaxID=76115 RepID=A0ABX1NXK7_9RHOO|nr:GatB/YqeY domain-containing protein [Aromatoleum bremense]NMG16765.1 GatB/YqeY domain-containing protein [Aromatoleum bremense]QTQ32844.1 YqeY-like [Aromatoleum bremense]
MSLKERIQDDMKAALRAKDSARLSAVRLLLAAVKQREIDERVELDDAAITATVEKLVKQRRDAASQYEAANRPELAAGERFEIEVLSAYLPEPLSDAELDEAITAAVGESGATSPADMGRVMALLKPRLAGRADMTEASRRVRARLSS